MVDLSIRFAGLELSSPVCVASQAPPSKAFDYKTYSKHLKRYVELGASMVYTPVTVVIPEPGRRVYETKLRFVAAEASPPFNKMGIFGQCTFESVATYLNDGVRMIEHLKEAVDVPIAANIMGPGGDVDGWVRLACRVKEAGADLIELNVTCPIRMKEDRIPKKYLKGLPESAMPSVGQVPSLCSEVVKAVKKEVGLPVSVKMSPELGYPQLITIPLSCKRSGADAVCAINAPLSIPPPDIYRQGRPITPFSENVTFMSTYGPWTWYLTLKNVALTALHVPNIDIAAVGGIVDPKQVVEIIMYGASQTQLSSGILWRGHGLIQSTIRFIEKFMKEQGYSTVGEMKGLGLKYIVPSHDLIMWPAVAKVDKNKCTGCKLCTSTLCIAMKEVDGKAEVDPNKCGGCGLCAMICLEGAVTLEKL